jgi:hypothetical protein
MPPGTAPAPLPVETKTTPSVDRAAQEQARKDEARRMDAERQAAKIKEEETKRRLEAEKARMEAEAKRAAELKTTQPSVTATPAPIENKAPATAAPALSQGEDAAARDALRRKIEQAEVTETTRSPGAPTTTRTAPESKPLTTNSVKPGAPLQPAMPTIESKLPRSKAQRLSELTERYRRDEMTPAEYHSARAKILAEPNQ